MTVYRGRRNYYDVNRAAPVEITGASGRSLIQRLGKHPHAMLDVVPHPPLYRRRGECAFCRARHDHGKVIDTDATCTVCGSPLHPAENRRFEWSGRRAVARIGNRQDILFYTRWPQAKGFRGRTDDISLHGMRFVTRKHLCPGQPIKIVSGVVEAVADVTHCHRRRCGIVGCSVVGVAFITIRFLRAVGAFVSERA